MADAVERGLRVGVDLIEQPPERLFPGRVLVDLFGSAHALVAPRVEVTRAARADVERVAPRTVLGQHVLVAYRIREDAHPATAALEVGCEFARAVQDDRDDRVVTDIRVAAIHVQQRDVDRPGTRGRNVPRRFDPKRFDVRGVVWVSQAEFPSPFPR